MKKKKRLPCLAGWVTAAFLFVLSVNLSALVYLNGSNGGYSWLKGDLISLNILPTRFMMVGFQQTLSSQPLPTYHSIQSQNTGGKQIKSLIQAGGTDLWRADAYFSLFLSDVEESGLNNPNLSNLDLAIKKMSTASESFKKLVEAVNHPDCSYNHNVIDKLKTFDYEKFGEKYRLRADVVAVVKGFLSKGDINGVYQDVLQRCRHLLDLSENIRMSMGTKKTALVTDILNLSESYANTMAFGQYVARVFADINIK